MVDVGAVQQPVPHQTILVEVLAKNEEKAELRSSSKISRHFVSPISWSDHSHGKLRMYSTELCSLNFVTVWFTEIIIMTKFQNYLDTSLVELRTS